MRRILVGLVAALPLALGAGAVIAQADQGPWGSTGQQGPTGQQGSGFPIPVVGTVVSTDAGGNADSFVANAYVPSWPGMTSVPSPWNHGGGNGFGDQGSGRGFGQLFGSLFGALFSQGSNTGLGSALNGGSAFGNDLRADDDSSGSNPATTQVTITAGDDTKIWVNGTTGTVGGMTAGDEFVAFFDGTPGESINDLVANAPLAIIDHTPPKPNELYAFVGTVSNVTTTDTDDGTVTVDVQGALPTTIASSGASVPLTVTADTLILGGSSSTGLGTTLADINDNDIVVGGLVAPEGDTLSQVEALPLRILLDIPVTTTSDETSAERTAAKEKALKKALAMIGEKLKTEKKKDHKSKKSHKKSTRKHHSTRKHSGHVK